MPPTVTVLWHSFESILPFLIGITPPLFLKHHGCKMGTVASGPSTISLVHVELWASSPSLLEPTKGFRSVNHEQLAPARTACSSVSIRSVNWPGSGPR